MDHTQSLIGFNKFTAQILKDETLGIGFFGRVCKAKCGELICAAKILHPTLFNPTAQHQIADSKECIVPIRRFEQECEFLSVIRHPNVVQYLMLHHDPETGLPVLMMELMDSSLTQFLESSTCPIPYHIEVNICHDIVLALSYLHSNDILHRDLSGNNVLLIGNARAKLSDFGMAKLADLNHRSNRLSLTLCPGTDVYMPPEAMEDHPKYTDKIDCFSFGVIVVQILTRQFPKPGDRNKIIEINHPEISSGTPITCKVAVPEIDRRQSQIKEVRPNHPLLPIAKDCLKDKETERPSSNDLCKIVASLKEHSDYQDSSKAIQATSSDVAKDKEIEDLQKQLAQKNDAISAKEDENQLLRKQLEQYEHEKAELLSQIQLAAMKHDESNNTEVENKSDGTLKTDQLPQVSESLLLARSQSSSKESDTTLQSQIDHNCLTSDSGKQRKFSTDRSGEDPIRIQLTWKKGHQPPCEMYSSCNAVGDGDCVYIRPGGLTLNNDQEGRLVYMYNLREDSWSKLPKCPNRNFSIAMVNGSFTAIGGYYMYDSGGPVAVGYRRVDTNVLLSLNTVAGESWIQMFPPMLTTRSDSTALTTSSVLVVVGGQYGHADFTLPISLSTVEVMNTDTLTWSKAAPLPLHLVRHSISATACEDNIYLFGVQHIFSCSLTDLLDSCKTSNSAKKQKSESEKVWKMFAALPVREATGISIHGQLLAIGGNTVFMYQTATNSWESISYLSIPRVSCSAAVIPGLNQIVIVGGHVGVTTVVIASCTYGNP